MLPYTFSEHHPYGPRRLRVRGMLSGLLSVPGAVTITVAANGLCAALSRVTSTATPTCCWPKTATVPVVGVRLSQGTSAAVLKVRASPQAEVSSSVCGGGLSPAKALTVRALGSTWSRGPVGACTVVVVRGLKNGPRNVLLPGTRSK